MNGWDHVFLTTVGFMVVWLIIGWIVPLMGWVFPFGLSLWLFLVAWVGGIFPDFDTHWKPLLGHRSIVTHSIFAPLLIVGISATPVFLLGWWTPIDRYLIMVFLLAVAGHFFLDLAPSTRSVLNRFMKNPFEALVYIEKGMKAPPGNITYVPKQYERAWLIGNGLTLVVIVVLLQLIIFPLFGL